MRGQHGEHFTQNKGALGNASVNATLENPVQFWTFVSAHPAGAEVSRAVRVIIIQQRTQV